MTFKQTDQNVYCLWSAGVKGNVSVTGLAWLDVGVKEKRSDVEQEQDKEQEEERRDRVSCYFICGSALEHNTN